MTARIEYRPMREDDLERVRWIRIQAFGGSLTSEIPQYQISTTRVLQVDGVVQAILGLLPMAHFFGGSSVPSGGVASVAVSSEARGTRIPDILMREAFDEMRGMNLAVSVLYPSRVSTYRRAGYELAGRYTRYRAGLSELPTGSDEALEPWGDEQLAEIIRCYQEFARTTNGLVDRSADWFKNRILHVPPERALYRYLYRSEGKVLGYLVFSQEPASGSIPIFHEVRTRDLIWTNPAAAKAVTTFLSRDSSLGKDVTWLGPTEEPLSLFFKQQSIEVDMVFGSMLRLVDVKSALEARGYPVRVETALEIKVVDPIIRENNRGFKVEVEGGAAKALPSETARARIDVSTLAAIFTGWLPARDAVRAGRLENASDAEVESLELMFSGPKPWMMDFF